MSKIQLVEGQITPSDSLVIELIESIDTSPAVLLRWPGGPFFTQPHRLPAVANQIMAIRPPLSPGWRQWKGITEKLT